MTVNRASPNMRSPLTKSELPTLLRDRAEETLNRYMRDVKTFTRIPFCKILGIGIAYRVCWLLEWYL
jgi:hypothetical protein